MKVSFTCVLHDDVHIPFICEELMQFYHILMVYSPEDLYLRTRLFRIATLNNIYATLIEVTCIFFMAHTSFVLIF